MDINTVLGPLLLAWININPAWICNCMPSRVRMKLLTHSTVAPQFQPTFYNGCNYLSMRGLRSCYVKVKTNLNALTNVCVYILSTLVNNTTTDILTLFHWTVLNCMLHTSIHIYQCTWKPALFSMYTFIWTCMQKHRHICIYLGFHHCLYYTIAHFMFACYCYFVIYFLSFISFGRSKDFWKKNSYANVWL